MIDSVSSKDRYRIFIVTVFEATCYSIYWVFHVCYEHLFLSIKLSSRRDVVTDMSSKESDVSEECSANIRIIVDTTCGGARNV